MGGIVTDLDGRATGVERLYAVGECACTGLHGANRLASNSLSECFVFGRRAALDGARRARPGEPRAVRRRRRSRRPRRETRKAVWASPGWSATRATSTRSPSDPYPLARLVAASALARDETRGSHARAEFPEPDPALDAHHTILDPGTDAPRFEAWPS